MSVFHSQQREVRFKALRKPGWQLLLCPIGLEGTYSTRLLSPAREQSPGAAVMQDGYRELLVPSAAHSRAMSRHQVPRAERRKADSCLPRGGVGERSSDACAQRWADTVLGRACAV